MRLRYLVLLMAVATSTANAAFYVDEDTPQDTAQIMNVAPPKVYDIPFYVQRSQLGPLGRKTLEALFLEADQSDQITITGYGDTLGGAALGRQRATTIYQWLIENGIPRSKISIVEDNTVRPTDTRNIFNSTITFSSRATRPVVSPDRQLTAALVRNVQEPTPTVLPPASHQPLDDDQVKLAIATKLVAMGHNNIIKPEDAVVLLAEFLGDKSRLPPAPSQPVAAPILTPALQAPPLPQMVAATDLPRTWTLSSTKTLKDNLADWAADAGWEAPIWEASNPYQITVSSPMTGTFLDVLGQIATAVPDLDFKVWRDKRILQVFDRNPQ